MSHTLDQKQKDREDSFLRGEGWFFRKKNGKQRAGYVHRDYEGRFAKQEALEVSGWKP